MRKGMVEKFVLLILFANFSICICSTTTSSALNQDIDIEFNKQSISSGPCFEKYITESYFRQHDSLVDSKFKEFLRHNLPLSSEKLYPRLLDLGRHLIGEGSHRRLSSTIRFSMQRDLISDLPSGLCEVIVIERLPSGVFADPFELEHILQRRGNSYYVSLDVVISIFRLPTMLNKNLSAAVFKDVSVLGDINLELPSFRSNRSIVEVHLDMGLNKTSGEEIVQELKIELPLHARYPPLEESGYSKVMFGIPDLLFRCKSLEVSPAQSCLLTRIVSSDNPQLDPVMWLIPAGIKAHAALVSVVSFASALLSAILIITVSLKQNMKSR